ncbi:MAG: hypothetical protein F6K14_11365 [Symploca sp. SIO2C1]|nr:hypothetical protein [Symploca sp. SIO2C1]
MMSSYQVKSVSELAERVSQNPQLAEDIKRDPVDTIRKIGSPLKTDRLIYRIVVSALGLTMLTTVIGATWLAVEDKPIPDILVGLGTGALGSLAGLLAPSPSKE